jgi:hypothetical protein
LPRGSDSILAWRTENHTQATFPTKSGPSSPRTWRSFEKTLHSATTSCAARGLQRVEVDCAHWLCLALYAPRPSCTREATYQQTRRWLEAGVFEEMVHDLRLLLRLSEGRVSDPTATILDSRTLLATPESGSRGGYDGAKERRVGRYTRRWILSGAPPGLVRHSGLRDQERAWVGELAEAVQEATGESVELA